MSFDMYSICKTRDPQGTKRALMPYAGNEGPDQTAHSRSLIWVFVVRLESMATVAYIIEQRRP